MKPASYHLPDALGEMLGRCWCDRIRKFHACSYPQDFGQFTGLSTYDRGREWGTLNPMKRHMLAPTAALKVGH